MTILEIGSEENRSAIAPLFSDDPDLTGRKTPKTKLQIKHSSYVAKIDRQWKLNGHRWLLHEDSKKFFTDFAYNVDEKLPSLFATDRNTDFVQVPDGSFEYATKKRGLQHIDGSIGLAISAEPTNWGSFLFRIVPKLVKFKLLGIEKVLMYNALPQQKSLAALVGFDDAAVIPHRPYLNYTFESGVVASQSQTGGFVSPFARAALQGIASRFLGKSKFGSKIYISRRGGIAAKRNRHCINEEEVQKAVQMLGFEIVVPDTLTVEEQIAAFANAKFVIGPAGAGLFNCVFCRPLTKLIDIESESHWIFAHTRLFSSLGLRYGIFWAQAQLSEGERHVPFIINVAALVERIQWLEDRS
jgi:capsular polysaccharide biosynthesis protein